MGISTANPYLLLADAFCYPAPGQLSALDAEMQFLPAGSIRQSVATFLDKIRSLSLGEWEELHTLTLDLNPPAAPYIGFQTWGESYQRGNFLSLMNRELMEMDIDMEGELPDHLIPVLRYLAQASEPLAELIEVLVPALQRMHSALRKADAANPYLHLLEAVQISCEDFKKEAA